MPTLCLSAPSAPSALHATGIDPVMLTSAIHDIKNMLQQACSQTRLALANLNAAHPTHVEQPTTEEVLRDSLQHSLLSIEHASSRINTLLSSYRTQHDEHAIALAPVNLAEWLDSVQHRLQPFTAQQPAITLEWQSPPHMQWLMDRELMSDLLVNAVQNALRYTHSRICITCSIQHDGLHLSVEDDGMGFPTLPMDTLVHGGHGLQLAERIAQRHQRMGRSGSLILGCSRLLHGALFEVVLP